MKKIICLLIISLFAVMQFTFASSVSASETKINDFSDNFESYNVNDGYIENDSDIRIKWDNNVFRGGEALGMDSHIMQVGKIEYESGNSGNKVLHLNNTQGANTFFYMGPEGDYRTKNFTASFKIKFLTDSVSERSWVGLSFRKKSNTHYTGTNNLLFFIQKYLANTHVSGHALAIFNGGSTTDLSNAADLYGDKLTIDREYYSIPGAKANADTPWLNYKLTVEDNTYKIYVDDYLVTDCTFNISKFDYFGFISLNCCTANVLIDDFNVTILDETLPPVIAPLSSPIISVNQENKEVRWDYVSGSTNYLISIDGNKKTLITNRYSLEKLGKGEHKITVIALSDDTFEALDSLPSNEVVYVVADDSGAQEGDGGCSANLFANGSLIFALCGVAIIMMRKKYEKNN